MYIVGTLYTTVYSVLFAKKYVFNASAQAITFEFHCKTNWKHLDTLQQEKRTKNGIIVIIVIL